MGILGHLCFLPKGKANFPVTIIEDRFTSWQVTPIEGEGNGNSLQYSCLEKSHGQSSLVGCSPWGRYKSDTIGRLHFHFSLSHIGEGHGNPLQCSCLENPRDGGAWWAAVYRVAQSWTRLKRQQQQQQQHISIFA